VPYFENAEGSSLSILQLINHLAAILHSPGYIGRSSSPMNFEVRLYRDKRRMRDHSGSGSLTLPTVEAGQKFLYEYGMRGLSVDNRTIKFRRSNKSAPPDVVQALRTMPYLDPRAAQEEDRQTSELRSASILVSTLQFGWECRDQVFSIEWERNIENCGLFFEPERREIHIKHFTPCKTIIIVMRFSQIVWSSAHMSSSQQPVIFFSLAIPPAFESVPEFLFDLSSIPGPPLRQRLSAYSPQHELFAPYTSLAIRLLCRTREGLKQFQQLCRGARFPAKPGDFGPPVEYRGLFSENVQRNFCASLLELPWLVAFQLLSLVQALVADVKEMLALIPSIKNLIASRGERYACGLLRHFSGLVRTSFYTEDAEETTETFEQCFIRSVREYGKLSGRIVPTHSENVFDCLHAIITPTTIYFEGPYPDRSNRVIRSYPGHEDHFMRVSFVDEGRLQYRFDREVDGRQFIKNRFGKFLSAEGGLEVAGRHYQFLAYSQSALKEHAVWFVAPFYDLTKGLVNASTIINSLGSFTNLSFDRELIHCPARYGARISQAFTATDTSVIVEAEEIFNDPDIERNGSCFTDGVGTMSRDMAIAISKAQAAARKRPGKQRPYAHTLQIRFMGSKGMLSINHRLPGRAVCLRPSMIKFEAPESRGLEIARVFDKPGRYFLNRPLIMIMEGLGIKYDTFKHFQDEAVLEARDSAAWLSKAGRFLEAHGLGTSFRLTSVMINLDKVGIPTLEDHFYQQMMEFGINHVLRDLKQRARIPIPGGWTLVGVADVHGFLENGQIFACIKDPSTHKTIYLEGPVLISRSPTIHPGDVQIARAIGRPPAGSCFEKEALPNAVVFSIKGR
jgi:RNA-dependent RNA polymerase